MSALTEILFIKVLMVDCGADALQSPSLIQSSHICSNVGEQWLEPLDTRHADFGGSSPSQTRLGDNRQCFAGLGRLFCRYGTCRVVWLDGADQPCEKYAPFTWQGLISDSALSRCSTCKKRNICVNDLTVIMRRSCQCRCQKHLLQFPRASVGLVRD